MNKKELNELKQQAKVKAKALADAHKSKPPKSSTKSTKTQALKQKPVATKTITSMIDRIIGTLDGNIDRLVGDMSLNDAIAVIERLQELRDTENYHELKWGK